eukprot:2513449-Alexandrium_andersonii.AAC.1
MCIRDRAGASQGGVCQGRLAGAGSAHGGRAARGPGAENPTEGGGGHPLPHRHVSARGGRALEPKCRCVSVRHCACLRQCLRRVLRQ